MTGEFFARAGRALSDQSYWPRAFSAVAVADGAREASRLTGLLTVELVAASAPTCMPAANTAVRRWLVNLSEAFLLPRQLRRLRRS